MNIEYILLDEKCIHFLNVLVLYLHIDSYKKMKFFTQTN